MELETQIAYFDSSRNCEEKTSYVRFLNSIYTTSRWSILDTNINQKTNLDFSGSRDAVLGTLGVLEALGSCFSKGLGELDLTAAGTEGVAAAAEGSARSWFGSFDNLEARENTPCIGLHWKKN